MIAAVILAAPGCATRAMRSQAAALAAAGDRLESETAAFTAARSAVVQLRQRNLVQRRQEVAEQGQYNARTLAQWRVAGTEDRVKRLALFTGVVAGSEASYEVRDQGLAWEESVLAARTALAIDGAALHRFVRQLLGLSRPLRFTDGVRFYVEYGAHVSSQVDAELAEVQASVAAAQDAMGPPSGTIDAGPGAEPPPTTPPKTPPTTPPKTPPIGQPPTPPKPRGPETIGPGQLRRDPVTGITTPPP